MAEKIGQLVATHLCSVAFLVLLLYFPNCAAAQAVFREGFEGPEISWQLAGHDTRYRKTIHCRQREQVHSGTASEQFQFVASHGTFLHLAHPIGPARVIEELSPSVWVRGNKPGVQILAEITLPRIEDPRTGRPLTTFLRGTSYTAPGSWQQLRIENIAQLLSRRIRVLRSQYGSSLDAREAYVEQIVLNVYGGSGENNVWIDDLEVTGIVRRNPDSIRKDHRVTRISHEQPAQQAGGRRIRLRGTTLLVDGRPMLPRVAQYQGEPLQRLQQSGFNVVQIDRRPTPHMLAEAKRLGMWLIAPPPGITELNSGQVPSREESVLAWDLGSGLLAKDIESTQRWAQLLRRVDPKPDRPLLAAPATNLRQFSRIVDIIVLQRDPIGGSLELGEYAKWLAGRPRLARPGTPFWVCIQTDVNRSITMQWKALAPPDSKLVKLLDSSKSSLAIDQQQIRLLVHAAMAAGARGFLFTSQSSLTETDTESRRRAVALELMNLELSLIEPWIASGSFVTAASSSDSEVSGVALQNERSRILLPIRSSRADQLVPSAKSSQNISFIVPGIPESNDAYDLSPIGLRPLRHKRVTGGIRVREESFVGNSLILMTSDPIVVSGLSRRTAILQRRAATLSREQAARKLAFVESIERQLVRSVPSEPKLSQLMTRARSSLTQSERFLSAGDHSGAYRHARSAMADLGQIQRMRWNQVVHPWKSVVASPLAAQYRTLPEQVQFSRLLKRLTFAENRLPGGDFENLQQMVREGWRHFQHPVPGIKTAVELSPRTPHGGDFSLLISASPENEDSQEILVESPPAWITSPPMQLPTGRWVKISGWVRVEEPISGSVDGLLILDSHGGFALAERIQATGTWRQFTLYRAASREEPLSLTFALSGFGKAWIDNVTCEILQQSASRQEIALPRNNLIAPPGVQR